MKKVFIICCFLLLFVGCVKEEKFYLDSDYYKDGEFIDLSSKELKKIKSKNYILYTYNSYCTFTVPCENVFKGYMNKYHIDFVSIPFEEFKKTSFYKTVSYGPSILIIKDGKIITYLDAEDDEDIPKYQNLSKFENWINKYIYTEKK